MPGTAINILGELDDEYAHDERRWRYAQIGPKLGAERAGATVYELEPGQRFWPYHYHYGNEEWLVVLRGRPTLRTPEGERELREGDVVCFPPGPEGAHTLWNDGGEAARFVIASTNNRPGIVVYPDSDKVGVRPGDGGPDHLNLPRSAALDYWDGE